MPMPLIALTDHLPREHFQSGEQGGGTVTLVIMRHGSTTPFLEGQAGLSPIQRLNLALFVHAQHEGLLWRI